MKIFLAAAHGGNDPGAVANNTTEAIEVKAIVEKAAAILKPHLGNGNFLIVVPHDLDLEAEVDYINRTPGVSVNDICLEINMNSNQGTPGTGTETYYGYPHLADIIQKILVKEIGLADRGVKDGDGFYFNNMTTPGSALVEMGFINNVNDLVIVREKGPKALAKAIANYLGIILPEPTPTPTPTPPNTPPVPGNLKKVVIKGKIITIEINGENLLIN